MVIVLWGNAPKQSMIFGDCIVVDLKFLGIVHFENVHDMLVGEVRTSLDSRRIGIHRSTKHSPSQRPRPDCHFGCRVKAVTIYIKCLIVR